MTQETKKQLISRLKSLVWRVGMFALLMGTEFVAQNVGLFSLPTWSVALVSYNLSEVTKYLNTVNQK